MEPKKKREREAFGMTLEAVKIRHLQRMIKKRRICGCTKLRTCRRFSSPYLNTLP